VQALNYPAKPPSSKPVYRPTWGSWGIPRRGVPAALMGLGRRGPAGGGEQGPSHRSLAQLQEVLSPAGAPRHRMAQLPGNQQRLPGGTRGDQGATRGLLGVVWGYQGATRRHRREGVGRACRTRGVFKNHCARLFSPVSEGAQREGSYSTGLMAHSGGRCRGLRACRRVLKLANLDPSRSPGPRRLLPSRKRCLC